MFDQSRSLLAAPRTGLGMFTSAPLGQQPTGTLNPVQGCLCIDAGTPWLQGVCPPRRRFELRFGKWDFLLLGCHPMPPLKPIITANWYFCRVPLD